MIANKRETKKIGAWLINGDVGASSRAMAAVALGAQPIEAPAPVDPSDFARCIGLIECIDPSNRLKLVYAMAELTVKWRAIRIHWLELMRLWDEEKNGKKAPKLYAFMKKIGL